MIYQYRVSVSGEKIKESNTWSNIIKQATILAEENKGEVVRVRSANGVISESFIWSEEDKDIIPSY